MEVKQIMEKRLTSTKPNKILFLLYINITLSPSQWLLLWVSQISVEITLTLQGTSHLMDLMCLVGTIQLSNNKPEVS